MIDNKIRKRKGEIHIKFVMTDLYHTFYNRWTITRNKICTFSIFFYFYFVSILLYWRNYIIIL